MFRLFSIAVSTHRFWKQFKNNFIYSSSFLISHRMGISLPLSLLNPFLSQVPVKSFNKDNPFVPNPSCFQRVEERRIGRPFSNPWKHQKTFWFSDAFRGRKWVHQGQLCQSYYMVVKCLLNVTGSHLTCKTNLMKKYCNGPSIRSSPNFTSNIKQI